MKERDAGSRLEDYLVTDQGLYITESLRKALAVFLRTGLRSGPSEGFMN